MSVEQEDLGSTIKKIIMDQLTADRIVLNENEKIIIEDGIAKIVLDVETGLASSVTDAVDSRLENFEALAVLRTKMGKDAPAVVANFDAVRIRMMCDSIAKTYDALREYNPVPSEIDPTLFSGKKL